MVSGASQRGVETIPGRAVVVLPKRGETVPVRIFRDERIGLRDYLATLPTAPDPSKAQPSNQ